MNSKNPKDLTRAVARASKVLREAGIDVKHTQMLSAIAAFQGFSNREEFLQQVRSEPTRPQASATTNPLDLDESVIRELVMATREAAASRRDEDDESTASDFEQAAQAAEAALKRRPKPRDMVIVVTDGAPAIGYVHQDWDPKQGQGRIFGHKPGADYLPVYLSAPPALSAAQPSGLMPQLQLVQRVSEVLDRLANGEEFNDVCEATGISAVVSQQQVLLQGKTIAGMPAKAETFLERLQKMTPAELTHADFQLVLGALKRAFKDIEEKLGYTPSWMYPFVNIASSLTSDAERAVLDRAFPYKVVSYGSARDFRQGYGDQLVLVGDLAEGIAEMRKRLDENLHLYACALVGRDGIHRYTQLVRGLDGNYREQPDGLTAELSQECWDQLADELVRANTFPGCGRFFNGSTAREACEALQERICRKRGDASASEALEWLGLSVDLDDPSCSALYAKLVEISQQLQDHFAQDQMS